MNPDIHILSTRTLTSTSVTDAAKTGMIIDIENFIETQPVRNEALKEKIQQLAGQSLSVIFTSAHAVTSVFSLLHVQPKWQVFCISGATKTAVLAFLPENAIAATADYGAGLAEKILSEKTIRDIWFFCGNKRLNTIPETLNAGNIPLQELVVYETELRPQKISRYYDGILFFSPSAAESFFLLNKISEETILFSIGKTTAKALEKYTKNRIIICDTPKADLLIDQVLNFNFKQKTST